MQPLELLAVNYAVDHVNRSYSLALKVPRDCVAYPHAVKISGKVYSHITALPLVVCGSGLVWNDKNQLVLEEPAKILCAFEPVSPHSRITSVIIETFNGAAATFEQLAMCILIAKNAFDNPPVLVNYLAGSQAREDNLAAEIVELKGRIALLSAAKE